MLSLCVQVHKDLSQLLEMYKEVDEVSDIVISVCVGSQRPQPAAGDLQIRGQGV